MEYIQTNNILNLNIPIKNYSDYIKDNFFTENLKKDKSDKFNNLYNSLIDINNQIYNSLKILDKEIIQLDSSIDVNAYNKKLLNSFDKYFENNFLILKNNTVILSNILKNFLKHLENNLEIRIQIEKSIELLEKSIIRFDKISNRIEESKKRVNLNEELKNCYIQEYESDLDLNNKWEKIDYVDD
ncbi:MAG TPA: hypothetical protein DIS94_03895 [Bacteroidetes bacterium]|nr:hypothetical protein [Bacteroidota bacterium]